MSSVLPRETFSYIDSMGLNFRESWKIREMVGKVDRATSHNKSAQGSNPD
jgi:hypothetical protein